MHFFSMKQQAWEAAQRRPSPMEQAAIKVAKVTPKWLSEARAFGSFWWVDNGPIFFLGVCVWTGKDVGGDVFLMIKIDWCFWKMDGDCDGWWFWILDSWWRFFSFRRQPKMLPMIPRSRLCLNMCGSKLFKKPLHPSVLGDPRWSAGCIKGWWDICFELKERVESYFEICRPTSPESMHGRTGMELSHKILQQICLFQSWRMSSPKVDFLNLPFFWFCLKGFILQPFSTAFSWRTLEEWDGEALSGLGSREETTREFLGR